jgi:O-antigen ligase
MFRWLTPVAFALTNALVPLFPSFIMLAGVQPPGIALISPGICIAMLALLAVLGVIFGTRLLFSPGEASPMLQPLLAWLGAGVLSALLGFAPIAGAVFLTIFALGIVWNTATLRYYREPGVAAAIAWSMMLSCIAASLTAVMMVVLRAPVAQYVIGHGRAIGTFVLPGELAGYLIVMLPIGYAIAATTSNRALRAIAVAAVLCGAVAFVLTFSRAGWIALAVGVAFLVLVRRRGSRSGLVTAGAIVAAGLVGVLLLFNVAHNPSEDFTRLSIWQAAVQIIERFPLTGAGPFAFSHLYAVVRAPDGDATAFHAHSVYLTLLAETGIVGVAAAAWTWWSFAAELRRRIAADERHALLALAATAGLVGTLVQGLIDTVSIVLFALWLPTMAYALAAARDGLAETNA